MKSEKSVFPGFPGFPGTMATLLYTFLWARKSIKKERIENRRKFHNFILHFKSQFIYQYIKTVLKIGFQ